QRGQVRTAPVDAGAEARMVRVGERAGPLVLLQVLAQPALLGRVHPAASPKGAAVAVEGDEVPVPDRIAVVPLAALARDPGERPRPVEEVEIAARGGVFLVLVVAGHGTADRAH